MREIIFDTETTGLDNRADRIIEIGGIELFNHFPTGKTLHIYINPGDRKVHPDALAVHGITDEFLADKPPFETVVDQILEFFGDAKWIAHNATFDMGFVNAEFARLGRPPILPDMVIDTLAMARRKHPMGPNSLDALCRRYGIDNSHRTKHGALLDSELLAEVYIEMIGGRQTALGLGSATGSSMRSRQNDLVEEVVVDIFARPAPLPGRLTEEELAAHAALVAKLGAKGIWSKYSASE
ncbi:MULTISPECIES: DNA polymerase III subunit epsilon [Rhizobium]|uniref:DNA polymerase III subunit epsilon n=1 Tax=Rhizobium tropici TaxID=398 RepID=A0A329YQ38_RHITR|nr:MULTISPECIES: DNA polymerase III subunit epsilon [Rhizobium]MBB3290570.1 DNA polymerase-3 subunit epsilon [Rhizobium sp. BK252]MBB3405366.1 DNA polymerase-3 subunit epsilon [Rhizobium sp. BK289]MBB3417913.1 DNA polymerase-3 subunit epsilon [Rhizobium sp. BK284]MBB3485776.1 DNA polymerase-3 subunit epsilon [Rhizobium sp. BK347]MDK4722791.1 DNA polymerase III subunit epsilon [Rhizobium sp. CNPSo 3968]